MMVSVCGVSISGWVYLGEVELGARTPITWTFSSSLGGAAFASAPEVADAPASLAAFAAPAAAGVDAAKAVEASPRARAAASGARRRGSRGIKRPEAAVPES